MAISLKKLGNQAKKTVKEVGNATKAVVNNTIKDIENIIGAIGDCASAIDSIRVRVINRAIEYQTTATRILANSGVLPIDIIEKVWDIVGLEVRRNPNPKIYHLKNPYRAIWVGDQEPIMDLVDVNNVTFDMTRTPYIFVHGAFFKGTELAAYSFYEAFEKEVKMFNNPYSDYSDVDIFIVSYDSSIEEQKATIKSAFSTVLKSQVVGNSLDLYAAVMWKELERRAKVTGNKVFTFFEKMSESGVQGRAITDSLGCFVLAQASNRFIKEQPEMNPPLFSWFCIAPAIPSNAFTNTGMFSEAPRIAGAPDGPAYGTSVFFSYIDPILGGPYFLANQHSAMGTTGALVSKYILTNLDVSKCVKVNHGIPGKYLELLAPTLRSILRTQESWILPGCTFSFFNN